MERPMSAPERGASRLLERGLHKGERLMPGMHIDVRCDPALGWHYREECQPKPPTDGYRTPTGFDEYWARYQVRQIIDSYTLTMVGSDTLPYIEACADDVMHVLLGWPVTYKTTASGDGSSPS